jgi:phospholipase/lecithinase/hemolysin
MSFTARATAFAKPWLFSFVLIIGLLAPGLASADGRPFDRIVVFGDSLSDSGNLFALGDAFGLDEPGSPNNNWSMNTDEELLTLIPDQAYITGRLSNGPTWVELLGTALGRGRNVKPAFVTPDLHALNFAVAGATASNLGGLPDQFDLSGQVGAFLARADQIGTTSDTLYVIAVGGNDMRAAAASLVDDDDQTTPESVFTASLESLRDNIVTLYGKGATKILIWNAPDLGRTPAIQRFAAAQCAATPQPARRRCIEAVANGVSELSLAFNGVLESLLNGLEISLGIDFIRFDAFGLLKEVQEHKARYGLKDAMHACIEPFKGPDFKCEHPDRFFFWDGIHPTRTGHAIIAFLVGKALVTHALQDD